MLQIPSYPTVLISFYWQVCTVLYIQCSSPVYLSPYPCSRCLNAYKPCLHSACLRMIVLFNGPPFIFNPLKNQKDVIYYFVTSSPSCHCCITKVSKTYYPETKIVSFVHELLIWAGLYKDISPLFHGHQLERLEW